MSAGNSGCFRGRSSCCGCATHPGPESFRAAYRERQQPLLPLCAWLGQNIRFALLGVAAVAGYPSAYLWTEVLAMNLVLFVLLLPMHEHNSADLQSSLALQHQASAY